MKGKYDIKNARRAALPGALLLALAALPSLSSCTADNDILPSEETVTPESSLGITVNGSYFGPSTRAGSGLSLSGECHADKISVWRYCWHGGSIAVPYKSTGYDWAQHGCYGDGAAYDLTGLVTKTQGENIDKWTTWTNMPTVLYSYNHSYHGIVALAYNEADRTAGKFSDNHTTSTKASDHKLTIENTGTSANPVYETPELYLGQLTFDPSALGAGLSSSYIESENGIVKFYFGGTSDKTYTCPLYGSLYRCVSLFNFTFTEIPDLANLTGIELVASDYPLEMTMLGWAAGSSYTRTNHGTYYPLTPASSDSQHASDVTLASWSVDEISDGEISASWFMLPSEFGTELTLRYWYREDTYDENGYLVTQGTPYYTDEHIDPSQHAALSSANAGVYNIYSNSAEMLIDGNTLVYNSTTKRFYSLANVKVNINGTYGEKVTVSADIEVEPNYEKSHDIELN